MEQKKFIIATILITCMQCVSLAQPGSLDSSFGAGGKSIISLGNFADKCNAVTIQTDGKILLGGLSQSSFTSSDFALVRCNSDGSLDTAFGSAGKVTTFIENRSEGNSLAIQTDGKIILGGSSDWFINLVRYNYNGALDTTFGLGGKVITDVVGYYSEQCKSLAIQSDGKILLGGYAQHNANDNSYFILGRYNTNGTLDSTFGIGGIVVGGAGTANSMAIQSDGKIVLGGASNYTFALERYNTNGTLDSTFGIAGKVITTIGSSAEGHSVSINTSGKILLAGYSYNTSNNSYFTMVQYNSDGTLDNSFGIGGIVVNTVGITSGVCNSASFQENGKILLAGKASNGSAYSDFAMVRFNSDGTLDNSFGISGIVITPIGASYSIGNSTAFQNDGKIVLGGYSYNGTKTDIAVARYNTDANMAIAEPINNKLLLNIFPNPFNSSATIKFNYMLNNAEIIIYNLYGNEVKHITNITGREVKIIRNNLANGVYLLELIEENKIISTNKIIVN